MKKKVIIIEPGEDYDPEYAGLPSAKSSTNDQYTISLPSEERQLMTSDYNFNSKHYASGYLTPNDHNEDYATIPSSAQERRRVKYITRSYRKKSADQMNEDLQYAKLKQKIVELETRVEDYETLLEEEKSKSKDLMSKIADFEKLKKTHQLEVINHSKAIQNENSNLEFLQTIKSEMAEGIQNLETKTFGRKTSNLEFKSKFTEIRNSKSWIERICKIIVLILSKISIIRVRNSDIIKNHYDHSVIGYFEFLSTLINANFISFYAYLYLIIIQIKDTAEGYSNQNNIFMFSYSNYNKTRQVSYSIVSLIVSISLFILFIVEHARVQYKLMETEHTKKYNVTNIAFATWSWDHPKSRQAYEKKQALVRKTMIEFAESDNIYFDRDITRYKYVLRKIIGIISLLAILYLTLLCGIYVLTDKGLAAQLKIDQILTSEFLLGSIIAAISWALAFLAKLSSHIDIWKSEKERNASQIWRFYLTKLFSAGFNVLIVSSTNGYKLHEIEVIEAILLNSSPVIDLNLYNCPENNFQFKLIGFILGEIVLGIIISIVVALYYRFKKSDNEHFHLRPGFNIMRKLTRDCTIQFYIWNLFPFIPIASIFGTILFYLIYEIEFFILRNFTAPPTLIIPLADFQWFMKQAYLLSLFVYALFFLDWFNYESKHNNSNTGFLCGPFIDGESPSQSILNGLTANSFTDLILSILSNVSILWIFIIYLLYNVTMLYQGKFILKKLQEQHFLTEYSTKKKLANKVEFLKEQFDETKKKLTIKIRNDKIKKSIVLDNIKK